MAVKNNWATGDPVTAAQLNDMGSAVLALQALVSGADEAFVATTETTNSNSYANLATTTDSVTVTVGDSGKAIVLLASYMQNGTAGGTSYIGIDVSGANTIAANDNRCFSYASPGANWGQSCSASFLFEGLTSGSTVFKMKYRISAGSSLGTFLNRRIAVIPL